MSQFKNMSLENWGTLLEQAREILGEDTLWYASLCSFAGDDTLIKETFRDSLEGLTCPPAESIILE